MNRRAVQRLIKKVANRTMITKPVCPRVLRHTFAAPCVKKGISTASLKKILGHDRLETTGIYLNICPRDALGELCAKVERSRHQRLEATGPLLFKGRLGIRSRQAFRRRPIERWTQSLHF
jgi:integrase